MHKEFSNARVDQRHVLFNPPDDANVVADLILAAVTDGSLRFSTA